MTLRNRNCICLLFACLLVAGFATPDPVKGATWPQASPSNVRQDWAQEFVEKNPLETKSDEQVSLLDLQDAIRSEDELSTLVRHIRRSKLDYDQLVELLQSALNSDSNEVPLAVLEKLKEAGYLDRFVEQQLEPWGPSTAELARQVRSGGVKLKDGPPDRAIAFEERLVYLGEKLRSENEAERYFAAAGLRQLGIRAVPMLLKMLQEEDPSIRKTIAFLLTEIIEAEKDSSLAGATGAPPESENFPPPKMAPRTPTGPESARLESDEPPLTVRVFFGTNRKIVQQEEPATWRLWALPIAIGVLLFGWSAQAQRANRTEDHRFGCGHMLTSSLLIALVLVAAWYWNREIQQYWSLHDGIRFGPVRDEPDIIHYGECHVSLPPNHESGKLERPWLGPENEEKHVVLKRTNTLEEDQFYRAVTKELKKLPTSSRDCFVFVHGFNVTFESAAMRTAQISYDLKVSGQFEGVPIFYSWPSAGSPILYSWDRAEIRNSKAYVKNFLQNIALTVEADKIHVVAHSMGADLVGQALAEIDSADKLFHQIVLAAPDIDRHVFRRDIAPALENQSVRATMYCSSNDFALQISNQFNNARRAGDTSDGVLVIKGIDTIDASDFRTDLLGHSYYGDCVPLATDIAQLMKKNASPNSEERHLKPRPWEELFYWVF